jgi:hypothetical protein
MTPKKKKEQSFHYFSEHSPHQGPATMTSGITVLTIVSCHELKTVIRRITDRLRHLQHPVIARSLSTLTIVSVCHVTNSHITRQVILCFNNLDGMETTADVMDW